MGSRDQAKESYEKALQLDPSEPRALSGFVALLIDMGLFARAGEIIEQLALVREWITELPNLFDGVAPGCPQPDQDPQ